MISDWTKVSVDAGTVHSPDQLIRIWTQKSSPLVSWSVWSVLLLWSLYILFKNKIQNHLEVKQWSELLSERKTGGRQTGDCQWVLPLLWHHPVVPLWLAALCGEADGAALQTDLQTVRRAAAVLQYPTIQHGLTRLLCTGRLPCRFHATAAANRRVTTTGPAHSTCQTLSQHRTHGQHLAEQTSQETVNTTVCGDSEHNNKSEWI